MFHLLDFISVFAPQKPVLAAPMAYWSRHLLAWLIARRQAAGACGRGLHPRGFATPHLLDFISVFAPQKPVLAAVRLHFACGGTALAGRRPRRGESGSRVWGKGRPRFRGADYESPTAYFLSIKKVGKKNGGRSAQLKNINFKFHIKFIFFLTLRSRPPKTPNGKEERFFVATLNSKNDMRVALSKKSDFKFTLTLQVRETLQQSIFF